MYETVDALFKGICNAIRNKKGTSELIAHQNIPSEINEIQSGGAGEFVNCLYETICLPQEFINSDEIVEEEITWNQES